MVASTLAARLTDVHKSYSVGAIEVAAVRGVSLEIQSGEFLSIAGPSGSGKTTLLNLIGALDLPTSGSVEIGNATTTGLAAPALADFRNTHLGFVFQSFNLIPVLTARENVEFPLVLQGMGDGKARAGRADAMLREVGLDGLGGRRPDELSGGQQQRVAIARALVKGPTLVLADEPTANLDSTTALGIIELMREINRRSGTTFVFSTHDPMVMEHASRLVLLRDGRIESDQRRSDVRSG